MRRKKIDALLASCVAANTAAREDAKPCSACHGARPPISSTAVESPRRDGATGLE